MYIENSDIATDLERISKCLGPVPSSMRTSNDLEVIGKYCVYSSLFLAFCGDGGIILHLKFCERLLMFVGYSTVNFRFDIYVRHLSSLRQICCKNRNVFRILINFHGSIMPLFSLGV